MLLRDDGRLDLADPFEETINASFPRSMPGPVRAAVDRRVRSVLAEGLVPPSRRPRISRRAFVLGIAVAVLAAAGGGIAALYRGIIDVNDAFRVEWAQATPLGLSLARDGYRVTVDRAYADIDNVMVAITVVDAEGRDVNQAGMAGATLTDDRGTNYVPAGAAFEPNGALSGANVVWFSARPSTVAGDRTFELVLDALGAGAPTSVAARARGPWSFTFALPVRDGSVATFSAASTITGVVSAVGSAVTEVRPGQAVGPITVRVRRVSATDATIRATIEIEGWTYHGAAWIPIGRFEYEATKFEFARGWEAIPPPGQEIEALASVPSRAGPWTIRIDEFVAGPGEDQVRVTGPWMVSFWMP